MRIPAQFRQLVESHKGPIDEAMGEAIAGWIAGGPPPGTKSRAPDRSPEEQRDAILAAVEMAPGLSELASLKPKSLPKALAPFAEQIREAFAKRERELSDPENFDR